MCELSHMSSHSIARECYTIEMSGEWRGENQIRSSVFLNLMHSNNYWYITIIFLSVIVELYLLSMWTVTVRLLNKYHSDGGLNLDSEWCLSTAIFNAFAVSYDYLISVIIVNF